MKEISREEVLRIAQLSRLNLENAEVELFRRQLSETFEKIGIIAELEGRTQKLQLTYQVGGLTNIYREDKIDHDRCLSQSEALSNCRRSKRGFFLVTGIFDEVRRRGKSE